MKFTLAVAALATAADSTNAWNLGGPSYGLMGPMTLSPRCVLRQKQALTSAVKQQQALMNRAFTQTSPRYQITDTDETFSIAVDVPGVKPEDIDVTLDDGDQVVSISGHRELTSENQTFKSSFSQCFSLDPAVDVEKFSASLKNGVLIMSAPKDLKRIEENIRKIPVVQHAGNDESDADEEAPTPSDAETKADDTKAKLEENDP